MSGVLNLRRKLMRYIKHYNKTTTPIRWVYAEPISEDRTTLYKLDRTAN